MTKAEIKEILDELYRELDHLKSAPCYWDSKHLNSKREDYEDAISSEIENFEYMVSPRNPEAVAK